MSDDRHAAVMAMPEAVGRRPLADHLAAQTTMSLDQIRAALAAAHADPVAIGREVLDGTGREGDPTGYRIAREATPPHTAWGRQPTTAELATARREEAEGDAFGKDMVAKWRRATNRA